jgi:hypothetical protein
MIFISLPHLGHSGGSTSQTFWATGSNEQANAIHHAQLGFRKRCFDWAIKLLNTNYSRSHWSTIR